MRRPHRLLWPLLAVLLPVLATATPAAADYRDVYKECERGQLTTSFSARDLQLASQRMSSYQRDYTNCSDAIHQAQTSSKRGNQGNAGSPRSGAGSGGGSGTTAGGGGSTGATGNGAATGGGASATGDSPSSGPAAPGAPAGLSADDTYIARTAAIGQADANGTLEAALASAKVPESALGYSTSGTALPTPLVVALVASGLLAIVAASLALLPRLRRFRGD